MDQSIRLLYLDTKLIIFVFCDKIALVKTLLVQGFSILLSINVSGTFNDNMSQSHFDKY